MFKPIRRFWEAWKNSLFDSYEQKPTVYKVGNNRYVRTKRLRTKSKSKGPYIK